MRRASRGAPAERPCGCTRTSGGCRRLCGGMSSTSGQARCAAELRRRDPARTTREGVAEAPPPARIRAPVGTRAPETEADSIP